MADLFAVIALVLLAFAQVAGVVLAWRTQRALRELGSDLAAARRVQADAAEALPQLLANARTAAAVVDVGVSGARTLHESIAAIPFGILEALPPTRAGAKLVRGVHDAIAGGIYDTLAAVNRRVAEAAGGASAAKHTAPGAGTPASRAAPAQGGTRILSGAEPPAAESAPERLGSDTGALPVPTPVPEAELVALPSPVAAAATIALPEHEPEAGAPSIAPASFSQPPSSRG